MYKYRIANNLICGMELGLSVDMILLLALSLAAWIGVLILLSDNIMQIIRQYLRRRK
jgi:hypothetical protein